MTDVTSTPWPAAQAQENGPTDEQLLMAFRHLCRPGWPATLAAALLMQGYRVAIVGLARNLHRRATAAKHLHGLPRPPAPPTPGGIPPNKHGRSEFSLAAGPKTDLANWRRSSPKPWMGPPFDGKRAAANDLDD